MRSCGVAQMGDGIAFETVGPALQNDELRFEFFEMRDDTRPCGSESGVIGVRQHGNIEFGAASHPPTRFLRCAGSGVKISPVLVQVGKDYPLVFLEAVEHAIAMMRIDIDICDALERRLLPQ